MSCDWCTNGAQTPPTYDHSIFPPHFTPWQIIELQLLQDGREPHQPNRYTPLEPNGERVQNLQMFYAQLLCELTTYRFNQYEIQWQIFQRNERQRIQNCHNLHQPKAQEWKQTEENKELDMDVQDPELLPIQRLDICPWMEQKPEPLPQTISVQNPNGGNIIYKGDDSMDYNQAMNETCYLGKWKGMKLQHVMETEPGRQFLFWWYRQPEKPQFKSDGPKRARLRKAIEYCFHHYNESIQQKNT